MEFKFNDLLKPVSEDNPPRLSVVQLSCCGLRELNGIHNYKNPRRVVTHAIARILGNPENKELKKLVKDNLGVYFDRMYYGTHATVKPAHIIFSYIEEFKEGQSTYSHGVEIGKLTANHIIENKLGAVFETQPAKNFNSGRNVTCYTWTPDWDACAKYLSEAAVEDLLPYLSDPYGSYGGAAYVRSTLHHMEVLRQLVLAKDFDTLDTMAAYGIDLMEQGGLYTKWKAEQDKKKKAEATIAAKNEETLKKIEEEDISWEKHKKEAFNYKTSNAAIRSFKQSISR